MLQVREMKHHCPNGVVLLRILRTFRAGLHNSESSMGEIDQHKFLAGRKNILRCTV